MSGRRTGASRWPIGDQNRDLERGTVRKDTLRHPVKTNAVLTRMCMRVLLVESKNGKRV